MTYDEFFKTTEKQEPEAIEKLQSEVTSLSEKIASITLQKGDQGLPGEKGDQGEPGYTPVKGVDYFDGKDGTNGTDGRDGIDGITTVVEKIREIDDKDYKALVGGLESLPANEKLDPIKGLKNFQSAVWKVQRYVGGGNINVSALLSDYLTIEAAASTYLSQADATSTYLTQAAASSTYLTQASAASTYLTQASAASTYLTQASANTTYLKLDGSNTPMTGDLSFDGARKIIGGSGVTSLLTLQGTSANGTSTAKAFRILVGNNGGTEAMTILNDGNIGLGQTSPTGNKLYVVGRTRFERSLTVDQQTVIDISATIGGTSLTGYGLSGNAYNTGTTTSNVIGTQFNAVHQSSSTAGNIIGHIARAQIVGASTGNVTAMIGVQADCYLQGSGNATTATAVYINGVVKTSTGTATTAYGLRINSITSGTNNYAIYSNTGLNRLGDQLAIEGNADRINLIVKAVAAQSTNLTNWIDSSSTVLAYITPLGGAVFNESGADADFRVESDGDAFNIFSDGGTNRTGFGTATPSYKVDVVGEINSTAGYRINGTAGASGTFTTADAKTVTATNGIITSIV